MKKIFSLLLVILLAVLCASCAKEKKPYESDVPNSNVVADYTVTVKKAKSSKAVELSKEDGDFIGRLAKLKNVKQKLFSGSKDYTITVDGDEYYYDSTTGELGNIGIKYVWGEAKEKFDSILISAVDAPKKQK